ncbi:hypothetical protein GWK08_16725 [Leptobacterium flavescens]|uniref:Uncharacterized protein n=1 Tax=Leptobacterium flavescens TaxID=472055 RepID=A0A6P0UNZ8_9FLAO|nr:hypothetical protein [Leptobacterium flavescens]NER15101.1 hypothetical protein [Leptobacterium flavescens]
MFTITMGVSNFLIDVDCFLDAIEFLEELEEDLGFMLSDEHATIVLNEQYAACECVANGNCWI